MLETIVTADMIKGVLDEITGLLPVILPTAISYIGLRKGIAFLFSSLRSA